MRIDIPPPSSVASGRPECFPGGHHRQLPCYGSHMHRHHQDFSQMHHCSTQLFDALVTLSHARDLLDGLAAASERLSKDFDNCSIATHRRKAGDAIIVRYGTVDSYELMIVDFLVLLLPT